ncbi:MAG: cadherin domain-containing protein [Pseudobdellovibrionaceae bacterium]|jgi:hypothetical protein|nr:cadherin domain-containing protein [Pseudobdellovibrionaceae bacterium]
MSGVKPEKRKLGGMALEKRLMLDASLPILAGQVLWLDAADATTILDADGDNADTGTGGNNDGFSGTVATWLDKSSKNFDVTATGAATPQYGVDTKNGLDVLTFDGIDDRMANMSAVVSGSAYTTFLVYTRTSVGGRESVFEMGENPNRNALFIGEVGSRYGYYMNGSFYNSASNYTPGKYDLASIVQAGTIAVIDMDSTNEILVSTSSRTTTTGLFVGDDSTSGDFLEGQIAEIIVYDRTLNALEVHDVENYLASKWGLTIPNNNPTISTNTGSTIDEASNGHISNLSASDSDNSAANLLYTITDIPDYGYLYNSNTSQILGVNDTFTQGDINSGYIDYYNTTINQLTDSFDFSVSDYYEIPATGTHSISITPQNEAPSISGWTQVSSENFEGGATGWSDNTTTTGGPILTEFLGRHALEGGAQNTYKTYTLSGTQDYAVISFDMYEIDSWDGESFYIYVDDIPVYTAALTQGTFNSPADGNSGAVSWAVQETTPFNANFVFGSWTDQTYHFVLTVQTTAASIKLGFSSTLNQVIADEAWGVDNIIVSEVGGAGIPGNFQVSEKSTNGDVVGTISATDPNAGDVLSYSISGGTGVGVFTINPTTGVITVSNAAMLDYETTTSYTLDITVTDDGTPPKSDTQTVTIDVLDIPENTAPVVTGFGPVSVNEGTSPGLVMGTVTSTDAESNTVTYSITAGNTGGMFSINSATGIITLNGTPDFETIGSYTLTVRGTDNGFGNLSGTTNITININDLNEAPVIKGWTLVSSENFEGGATGWSDNTTTVGNAYTTQYLGRHAQEAGVQNTFKTYTLSGSQDYAVIALDMYEFDSWDSENFIIYINDIAVYASALSSTIYDMPADGTSGGMSWTVQELTQFNTNFVHASNNDQAYRITLTVPTTSTSLKVGFSSTLDEAITNEAWGVDNLVIHEVGGNGTPGSFEVSELSANGDVVGTIYGVDVDAGDTLTYSITGGAGVGIFTINSATGVITVSNAAALNYEATTSYTLDIRVQDSGGLTDSVSATVRVLDAKENTAPLVSGFGTISVDENTASGSVVGTITSTDAEANTVTYSIISGNTTNMFSINSATGVITLLGVPDFENVATYTMTIRGTDNGFGLLSSTTTVTININDLNEAPALDPVSAVLATNPNLRYSAATGNFYMLSAAATNYAAANAAATSSMLLGQAGYLASVTSAAENAFLAGIIGSNTFIGGSDAAVEGDWRWTGGPENGDLFWQGTGTGSAQNGYYTNWNGGEPNNSGNEDVIQMLVTGRWNDISASSSARYLIEWDGSAVLASINNDIYSLAENSPLNSSIGFVTAIDPDAGDIMTYSIVGGTGASNFAVNASTGEITLTNVAAANFELHSSYTLDILVSDIGGLTDTRTITINILDQNDTPTDIHLTNNHLKENSDIGKIIGQFSSVDEDVADAHTYTLISNPGNKFSIVGTDLILTDEIDYEAVQKITLVVRTDDGNGGTYDKVINIIIDDEQDTFVPRTPDLPKISDTHATGSQTDTFGKGTRSIIVDTVNGGEIGQQGSFYGLEKAFQIIRENTTFRIKEWLNLGHQKGQEDLSEFSDQNPQYKEMQSIKETEDIGFDARYTNIRNALEAMERFADTQETLPDDTPVSEAFPILPDESAYRFMDKEFVDVMTYHEQKQERLRKALLNS